MRSMTLAGVLALLAGCSNADTYVVRSKVNGAWQVDARARVEGGIARFECRHSASGTCHFTLFDASALDAVRVPCGADADVDCTGKILKRFAVPVAGHATLNGLSGFRLCASHLPRIVRPDCTPRAVAKANSAIAPPST